MNAKLRFISALLVLSVFEICQCEEEYIPIVQLPRGKIRGHVLQSENGNDYYAFQEIPYAAPPVGENRFSLPKKPDMWLTMLNTTRNTVVCYQNLTKFYSNLHVSEDCLYANVYTPVKPSSSERLPVLVWIHGGGYTAESSTYEYYGPKYVMDSGVVVATFNYRLGPFGFLTTEDDVIPSNLGLKDQRFALQWISDNIELFGGNSSHITIVGESAGAGSVGFHLLGPWSTEKELFHAAVMQSGSSIWPGLASQGKDNALAVANAINPDFSGEDSTDILALLRNASADQLLAAGGSYGVTLEEEGDFSYPMLQTLMDGGFKRVPLLIGFNSEEWLYYALNPNVEEIAEVYDTNPETLVDEKINVTNRVEVGNQIHQIYTNTSFKEDLGAYIRFSSDNSISTPSLKFSELYSKYTNVYFYKFSYKGELGMETQLPVIQGAEHVAHAEDLKYMWDDETNSDLSQFPEADQLTLHRFVKLWTNFAKFYNPTPEADPILENVSWRPIDPENLDEIPYLNFNGTLEVLINPRQYQEIKKVLDANILPPFVIY